MLGGQGPSQGPLRLQESPVAGRWGQNLGALVSLSGSVACVYLVGSLVDSSGHILIPGIYDQVAPLTEEERKMYKAIDLDLEEYRTSSHVKKFLFDTKVCSQGDG